jgi:hypothetical protein
MGDQTDYERTDRPDTAQPPPVARPELASIHDLVIEDLAGRKDYGYRKYRTILTAGNGRDPLLDAYEESLDLCVYLRQAIEERKNPPTQP